MALALTGLVGACSGGARWTPTGPVELADFCNFYAYVTCEGNQTCCHDTTLRYPNMVTCWHAAKALCRRALLPHLSDPQYVYQPEVAGEVLARRLRSAKSCRDPDGQVALASLVLPARPPGAPCDANDFAQPCQDGALCQLEAKTCTAIGEEGDPCGALKDFPCRTGLICKFSVGEATCSRVLGQPCNQDYEDCGAGAECVHTPATIASASTGEPTTLELVCQEPYPNGATVLLPTDCASGLMELDSSHHFGVCVACRSSADCAGRDGFLSEDWLRGYCDAGVCRRGSGQRGPVKPSGSVCDSDSECYSLRCVRSAPFRIPGSDVVIEGIKRCATPDYCAIEDFG